MRFKYAKLAAAAFSVAAFQSMAGELELAEGINPAFSPDGKTIAFQRLCGREFHLGTVPSCGGEVTWIEQGPGMAAYPVWTPSGGLLYTWGHDDETSFAAWKGGSASGYGLRICKDGVKRDLTSGRCHDYTPDVSPDGKTAYFATTRWVARRKSYVSKVSASDIAQVDLATGDVKLLLESSGKCNEGFVQPAVSPDGRTLLWGYLQNYSYSWRIFGAPLSDVSSNTWYQVSPQGMTAISPRWHPSGKYICFTGFREGDPGWGVWVQEISSGNARRIADGENPVFSPDGKTIAYDRDRKIFVRGFDPSARPEPARERRGFEVVALVDSLDFGQVYDIETKTGMVQVLDHVLLTHATDIWWRDKGGGKMRFPSKSESWPLPDAPFDKRCLPNETVYGRLRLDHPRANAFPVIRAECERRGLGFGIHTTVEENHWLSSLGSPWTVGHPEFWCRKQKGEPWIGSCSIAYPEVVAHKLETLDERLELRPQRIFLDFGRKGGWSYAYEYTKPVLDEWRLLYGDEPPPAATDPRWQKLVGRHFENYIRRFSAKCRARGVEFIGGFSGIDEKDDKALHRSYAGFGWRKLAKEGVFDGVVVMGIVYDKDDPFGSTERVYRSVMADCGSARVYFQLSTYNRRISNYSKQTGLGAGDVVRRLIRLSRDVGAAGVVMECVDYRNYTPEMCEAIKDGIR